MSALKTYSFKDVTVLLGVVPIEGFADGDAIEFTLPASWTKQIGAGGAHTRSRVHDTSVELKLRLQQTSLSNATLEAFALADEAIGRGIPGLFAKDLLGNEIIGAPSCYVSQRPAMTYGAESGVREWTLQLVGATVGALGTPNS